MAIGASSSVMKPNAGGSKRGTQALQVSVPFDQWHGQPAPCWSNSTHARFSVQPHTRQSLTGASG